jgi:hypothetical protein
MEQDSPGQLVSDHTIATSNGNLPLAVLLGAAAALVGALAWAAITLVTNYQIGWMAVGVGFVVGQATRWAKGRSVPFRISAAVLALLGCVAGNYLTLIFELAKDVNGDILLVFQQVPWSEQFDDMTKSFQIMDLLFYGIAVYEGWLFSVPKEAS